MQATHSSFNSNPLYETKKSHLSRPQAEEQPPSELYQNPKKEIDELRAQLRRRQTDIIRLKAKVDDLTKQLNKSQSANKSSSKGMFEYDKKVADDMGKVSFIAENKQLRDENEKLSNQIMEINGRNNQLEKELRECRAELESMGRKVREVTLLQKMRQERFQDQLEAIKMTIKPEFIIDNDKELREGVRAVIDFLRDGVCGNIFDIFINSANQSEQRKTNSLIVFRNNLNQLRKSKRNCVLLCSRVYNQFKKVVKLYDKQYGLAQGDMNKQPRNTFNTWLNISLIEVMKGQNISDIRDPEERQMLLFRLLALYYRVKYPLKGEKNIVVDEDLNVRLQSLICQSLLSVLVL